MNPALLFVLGLHFFGHVAVNSLFVTKMEPTDQSIRVESTDELLALDAQRDLDSDDLLNIEVVRETGMADLDVQAKRDTARPGINEDIAQICKGVQPPAIDPGACIGRSVPFEFVHIPKCAGSTVQHMLKVAAHQSNLSKWEDLNLGPLAQRLWATQEPWKETKVFVGHMGYGLMPGFLQEHPFITTILRDPIDRVLSNWNYNRFTTHLRNMTFDEALNRSLAKRNSSVVYDDDDVLSNQLVWWMCDYNPRLCDNADPAWAVQKASHNLCSTHIVGLVSDISGYVSKLQQYLPWMRGVKAYGVVNGRVSQKKSWQVYRSDLSAKQLELMRERLWPDYRIYDAAKVLAQREVTHPSTATC